MPKIVDHDVRREQVLEATIRVVARSGLDGATMRSIAEEAGCSTGLVTHHFANRDDVIVGVLRHVHRRSAQRMDRHAHRRPAFDALAAVVAEALPLDDERRMEWTVWLAFWGAAVGDAALEAEHRQRYAEWRALVRQLLQRGVDDGSVRPDLDVRLEADRLVALVDGLGIQATLEPDRLKPRRVTALVKRHLSDLSA